MTTQIGSASCIHAQTELPVVYDFRSLDVQLGGQGAPLVPVGDHYLFSEYDACLNLGGIANISYMRGDLRVAFDISAFNIVMNHFSRLKEVDFDRDGMLASQGNIDNDLMELLNGVKFYKMVPPKSLGLEEILTEIIDPISKMNLAPKDILRTFSEHLALLFESIFKSAGIKKILITGGGAYNLYFVKLLKSKLVDVELVVPENSIIEFKEAIVFALLGALRVRGEVNILSSVTGAKRNSCSGSIIGKLK